MDKGIPDEILDLYWQASVLALHLRLATAEMRACDEAHRHALSSLMTATETYLLLKEQIQKCTKVTQKQSLVQQWDEVAIRIPTLEREVISTAARRLEISNDLFKKVAKSR